MAGSGGGRLSFALFCHPITSVAPGFGGKRRGKAGAFGPKITSDTRERALTAVWLPVAAAGKTATLAVMPQAEVLLIA